MIYKFNINISKTALNICVDIIFILELGVANKYAMLPLSMYLIKSLLTSKTIKKCEFIT